MSLAAPFAGKCPFSIAANSIFGATYASDTSAGAFVREHVSVESASSAIFSVIALVTGLTITVLVYKAARALSQRE